MIRHCVMFQWSEGVEPATKSAIADGLDQLASLAAVHAYQHGADLGLRDDNWDYVVVGDFKTSDDYSVYASDADHVALIADLIAPNITARAAVQYEITGG